MASKRIWQRSIDLVISPHLHSLPYLLRKSAIRTSSSNATNSPTKARASFNSWYAREEKDERSRLALASFLRDLYSSHHQRINAAAAAPDDANDVFARHLPSSSSYDVEAAAVRFDEAITPRNELTYLDACLRGSTFPAERRLHSTMVAVEGILRDRHNINVVDPEVGTVVVVGDLHGDLASLSHLFRAHGPPSDDVAYVFNGDLCDRGTHSAEVLYFVLCLFLRRPDRVFLNRGNHEDVSMNDAYGFFDELCRKYGVQTARVLRNTIDRLYVSMPLCTWVPKHETFIAHAGPPLLLNGRGASSEEIGKIQRKSFSRTAASKTTLGGAATAEEGTHILEALLWGDPDPHMSAVGVRASNRGAGILYSVDACLEWMTTNGVSCFVRSHQCVQFGYEKMRGNDHRCKRSIYTVFSSANYRGAENDGAVLLFTKDGITAEKYEADELFSFSGTKEGDPHCHVRYSKDIILAIFRFLDGDG